MWNKFSRKASQIDEMTPEGRNRYADFLRAASILVVVLGHWLLSYITVEDGDILLQRLLNLVPETQWLTWIFQVMPIFFFVGGMANAISWESARDDGQRYVDWLRKRGRRLIWPAVPVVLFWIPMALFLDWIGTPVDLVVLTTQVALIPLWFLAAYLCVVMISPIAYWLHEKLGFGAVVLLVAIALGVDIAHRAGVPAVGWTNYVWVWAAVHQGGFFWHDGRLPEAPIKGVVMALFGYGLLVVLTQELGYPLSMVGDGAAEGGTPAPGESNNTPPSIALVVLAIGQIGVICALRRPARRLLDHAKIWAPVVLLGGRLMTIYVWHMTAMIAVAAAAYPTGLWPDPDGVTAAWWLTRIPWLGLLTVALALLVFAFGRFERPRQGRPTSLEGWPARLKTIAGVGLTTTGLAILVGGGLYGAEGPLNLPVVGLVIFGAGLVGLGVVGTRLFGRWVESGPEGELDDPP